MVTFYSACSNEVSDQAADKNPVKSLGASRPETLQLSSGHYSELSFGLEETQRMEGGRVLCVVGHWGTVLDLQ